MAHWTISPGDWCHIDVIHGDRERAKRFYSTVFGWHLEDIPGVDYTSVTTSEDGIESGLGGLGQVTGTEPPRTNGIVPFIRPDDFEATLKRVEEAGGTVVIPKTDVMGFGWFAHFRDPDGNTIGLWEDAPSGHASGPDAAHSS
jgi:predicted enzyme related to lactoylglutathione lyase